MSHNRFTNDLKLAEQLAKTGNVMDLCSDPDWLEESARIEDECGGYVEAGTLMRDYVAQKKTSTPELRRQMRLQSILFTELHLWMTAWSLGGSFEATYTQARQVIRQHLQDISPQQRAWVEALLAEDEKGLTPEEKTVRAQTIPWLAQLFSDEDWQSLADTAAQAIAHDILHIGQQADVSTAVL
jgi:hypothetical protein